MVWYLDKHRDNFAFSVIKDMVSVQVHMWPVLCCDSSGYISVSSDAKFSWCSLYSVTLSGLIIAIMFEMTVPPGFI
jgi:hypothetical protein